MGSLHAKKNSFFPLENAVSHKISLGNFQTLISLTCLERTWVGVEEPLLVK